jgi:haloacid dehalogenase-like hydrolase
MGLELQIIFNKGAVMLLPPNINKAAGLRAALERLALSPHNVVGIGDAENDHAFLVACGCAAAVANALPAIKQRADIITSGPHGEGLVEVAKAMTESDLRHVGLVLPRRRPVLGVVAGGTTLYLDPIGGATMIAGSSGGGKSTVVTGLLERMDALDFQFCVVDPEGDYSSIDCAVTVGGPKQAPRLSEIVHLLARPDVNVAVNMLAIETADRPRFFAQLLPEFSKMRAASGRPHWLVIDEAHQMLPANWQPAPVTLPRELPATIFVTVHPAQVSPDVLDTVETVIGVGKKPYAAIEQFCNATGTEPPDAAARDGAANGQACLWRRDGGLLPVSFPRGESERQRHARKYAEGALAEDESFYFRGPDGRLNLRAQNLAIFLQMAAGVDDATWLHHLRGGDYSRWIEASIKDDDLAREVAGVEQDSSLSAGESRGRIKKFVDARYTAPARAG